MKVIFQSPSHFTSFLFNLKKAPYHEFERFSQQYNSQSWGSPWSPHRSAPPLPEYDPATLVYSSRPLLTPPIHSRHLHGVSPCWKIDSSKFYQTTLKSRTPSTQFFLHIVFEYKLLFILFKFSKARKNAFHDLDLSCSQVQLLPTPEN